MTTLDRVRALFVEGESILCVQNTYALAAGNPNGHSGKVWTIAKVGKTVWSPTEPGFRGTFPERASDVLTVDETSATWKIGRGDHTVTYAKVGNGA